MQIDYPIETLPAWIISSRQFKEFKEMYPKEITFPCLDCYMNNALSIEINSYDDIDNMETYLFGTMECVFEGINNMLIKDYHKQTINLILPKLNIFKLNSISIFNLKLFRFPSSTPPADSSTDKNCK